MLAGLHPVVRSGYDFGYLLKTLTCQPLPATEDEFFELLRIYFPNIVDVKYLLKQPACSGGLHGGLRRLSEQLEVRDCFWVWGLALCGVQGAKPTAV